MSESKREALAKLKAIRDDIASSGPRFVSGEVRWMADTLATLLSEDEGNTCTHGMCDCCCPECEDEGAEAVRHEYRILREDGTELVTWIATPGPLSDEDVEKMRSINGWQVRPLYTSPPEANRAGDADFITDTMACTRCGDLLRLVCDTCSPPEVRGVEAWVHGADIEFKDPKDDHYLRVTLTQEGLE